MEVCSFCHLSLHRAGLRHRPWSSKTDVCVSPSRTSGECWLCAALTLQSSRQTPLQLIIPPKPHPQIPLSKFTQQPRAGGGDHRDKQGCGWSHVLPPFLSSDINSLRGRAVFWLRGWGQITCAPALVLLLSPWWSCFWASVAALFRRVRSGIKGMVHALGAPGAGPGR